MININKANIAGTLVVYNSDVEVIANIRTYLNQVDVLYVIDNSDQPNKILAEWEKYEPNVCYLPNGSNLGIANALNQAAERALGDGYLYLLTMDDDSVAPVNMVQTMLDFLNSYTSNEKLGIISVQHTVNSKIYSYTNKVSFTMTSGNLLNLNAYKAIGGFNGNLFIDHVDHEFGIRLNNSGFSILEITRLKLIHKLGVVNNVNFFGKNIFLSLTHLNAFFILLRNGIYIIRKYLLTNTSTSITIFALVLKELLKSLIFEKNKAIRYKYVLLGISCGWKGKLGMLND